MKKKYPQAIESPGDYYQELQRVIKEKTIPHGVFLLNSQKKIKEILLSQYQNLLKKQKVDFSYQLYFGDSLSYSEFETILSENGFFSTVKVIHLKNASPLLHKCSKQLKTLFQEDTMHYIFLEDDSKKDEMGATEKKLLETFLVLSNPSIPLTQVKRWINKQFQDYDLRPPESVLTSLLKDNENDLDQLFTLVERISLEVSGVDKPDWTSLLQKYKNSTEAIIFALSDAIFSRDKRKAFTILENLVQNGKSYEEIFYYLLNQIAFLCEIKFYQEKNKSLADVYAVTKSLHPYRVKKAYEQLKEIRYLQMKKTFDSVMDIDYKRKKGTGIKLSDALIFFIENM